MSSEERPSVRREANPFPWRRLTTQQQDAIKKVAETLLSDLSDVRPLGSAYIDFDRRSRLIFIDGDRGMGKTSVLLTVRNLLENEGIEDGLPRELCQLREQRSRFKWLDTLDMEPLPPTANLLAAILVRILKLFHYPTEEEHLTGDSRVRSRPAFPLDHLDRLEQLAGKLNQFAHDAVLASQGTHEERAKRIDPTVYAS